MDVPEIGRIHQRIWGGVDATVGNEPELERHRLAAAARQLGDLDAGAGRLPVGCGDGVLRQRRRTQQKVGSGCDKYGRTKHGVTSLQANTWNSRPAVRAFRLNSYIQPCAPAREFHLPAFAGMTTWGWVLLRQCFYLCWLVPAHSP